MNREPTIFENLDELKKWLEYDKQYAAVIQLDRLQRERDALKKERDLYQETLERVWVRIWSPGLDSFPTIKRIRQIIGDVLGLKPLDKK